MANVLQKFGNKSEVEAYMPDDYMDNLDRRFLFTVSS